MLNFNPYRASSNPTAPSVSAGNLNQLLKMQQENISGASKAFGNIGKINRTDKLNNLIAKGSLDGMNEQQAQQFLTGNAGGSLTERGQANVDKLLGRVGNQDLAKAKVLESNNQRGFLGDEAKKKATALLKSEREGYRQDSLSDGRKRSLLFGLQDDNQNAIANQADIAFNRLPKEMSVAEKLDYLDKQEAIKAKHKYKKPSVNPLSALGAKKVDENTVDTAVQSTIDYISDNEDIIFDRKLEPDSQHLLDELIVEYTNTPEGLAMIQRGARPQEIYNEVSKFFDMEDTFKVSNLLPFGKEAFRRKLTRKTGK